MTTAKATPSRRVMGTCSFRLSKMQIIESKNLFLLELAGASAVAFTILHVSLSTDKRMLSEATPFSA